jgi:Flp pilus assembly protein TadD
LGLRVINKITLKLPFRSWLLFAPAALVTSACAHHAITASTPLLPSAISRNSVATAMSRQAVNAIDAGDGDLQARILRARVEANPADIGARLELARYYQHAGFPEVAVEHLRLACERDPESPAAHIALGKILRQEQRPIEAASVLRTFAERHRDDVEVWAWLGVLEDEAGNLKAGEAASRRAIALSPQRDDLQNNLGFSLLDQGRNAEAAGAFRTALALNPKSAIARNNLGLALAENPREAVLNWQALDGPASAHNNMAAALIESGHYAEARKEIETALNYDPHHAAALNNLMLVSELDGRPAQISAHSGNETPHHRGPLASAWHRLRTGPTAEKQKDSGNTLASK